MRDILGRTYRVFNLNDLNWKLPEDESDRSTLLEMALNIADGDGLDFVGMVQAAPPDWPETLFIFRDEA